MIKAIVQIGDMIKAGILRQFVVDKGTNLVCLNFRTDPKEIEVKIDRELTSEFLAKTGYIGVQRGSGKEYGVIFPDNNLKYIGLEPVSKTKFSLWNIKNELDETNKPLADKIETIISDFYAFENKKFYLKQAKEKLREIKSINGEAPFYIQVCIDGVPLWEQYKHRSKGETIESKPDGPDIKCLACGKRKILKKFDTNQLKFLKFFGKDKLGFFPEFSFENQWKVLPLCPDCAESVVLADIFLRENKLNVVIARGEGGKTLNLLVIPDIPGWQNSLHILIEKFFDSLINATSVLVEWKKLKQFDIYAKEIFRSKEINIHIIVNTYDGKALKIYSSLTNIPPSRIRQLAEALKNASEALSDGINIFLSLKTLYRLLAGKTSMESKKKPPFIKERFAETFKNLILGNEFPDLNLIKPGLELARWQFNNRERLDPKWQWINTIKSIEGFLLVKRIMEGYKYIYGGENMGSYLEEADDYVSSLPIYKGENSKIKVSLFFLGYLIAQIASKQRGKGLKDTILDKLQFRGMNKDQIMRLFNQVFEYMRIYDLHGIPQNSEIMGKITSIFDSSLDKWNLSPEETVYFILSGYAFLTSKLISKGKEKSKKEGEHE